MPYTVEFAPSAARELRKLERRVQVRLSKLTGTDAWRIRVGDYRIVYEIKDHQLIVLILRVAHRREVYR